MPFLLCQAFPCHFYTCTTWKRSRRGKSNMGGKPGSRRLLRLRVQAFSYLLRNLHVSGHSCSGQRGSIWPMLQHRSAPSRSSRTLTYQHSHLAFPHLQNKKPNHRTLKACLATFWTFLVLYMYIDVVYTASAAVCCTSVMSIFSPLKILKPASFSQLWLFLLTFFF